MELRQHIGLLIISIMISFLIWAWDKVSEKGYKAYIPLCSGVIMWCIFECFYWVITLMLL